VTASPAPPPPPLSLPPPLPTPPSAPSPPSPATARPCYRCVDRLAIEVHPDRQQRGRAAARAVAACIRDAIATQGEARVIFGCAKSEEHTSELQSRENLVCRLLL